MESQMTPMRTTTASKSSLFHRFRVWAQLDNSWDAILSTIIVVIVTFFSCANFAHSVFDALQYTGKALPFQVLTNDVAGLALHLGSLLLWAAMCFGTRKKEKDFIFSKKTKHFWVHRLLAYKVWGHDFLAVGFAPRLFACTMGILLFVSGNIIITKVVPGSKFLKPAGVAGYLGWPVGMGCRAQSTKPVTFHKTWGSRLHIKPPAGCYNVKPVGKSLLKDFFPSFSSDATDSILSTPQYFWDRPKNTIVHCMDDPPTWNKTCQKIAKEDPIENLVFPYVWRNGTRTLNKNRVCMYQCAKWKPLGFQALLKNSGSLLAGAVFIVKVIDSMTTSRFFPHYRFVSTDTTTDEVRQDIERVLGVETLHDKTAHRKKPFFGLVKMKRLFALMVITGIKMALISLTPRIDKDGYLTLDYYVTLVFMYAAVFAMILRNYHLYEFNMMVYTQDLWQKGKETFIGSEEGELCTVDLYEWFHLPAPERAQFILNFARSITIKKVSYYQAKVQDFQRSGTMMALASEQKSSENPLKQRLLDVQDRLKFMEAEDMERGIRTSENEDDSKSKKKKEKDAKGETERIVKCMKEFVGFTDVFQPDYDGAHTGTWRRCRVIVYADKYDDMGTLLRRGATGEILGKTHEDKLMVKWNQPPPGEQDNVIVVAETKEKGLARQREIALTERMVKNINMAIDPKHCLQHGDYWEEMQRLIDVHKKEHKKNEARRQEMRRSGK